MSRAGARLALALLALAGAPAGCVIVSTSARPGPARDAGSVDAPDTGTPPRDDAGVALGADATRAVLASLAARVVLPALRAFEAEAAALERATDAYSSSLGEADRATAQEAWRRAVDRWQELEVMQLGPAGMMPRPGVAGTPGGRDLRDPIYSWPFTNTCRVDQEVVSGDYEDVDRFAATELVNVRGLDELEYLLFALGDGNTCSATAAINAMGLWAALGPDGVRTRRARYARALGILVHRHAVALREAWDPGAGDFAGQLGRAGLPGSVYPSAQEGLNAVSTAMFYVELELKDMKLGWWLGMGDTCMDAVCPALLESRWAGRSRAHLLANLRAFQHLFLGDAPDADAPGFDDLLRSIGAGDLESRMRAALDGAIAAVEALPELTPSSLAAGADAVARAYDAVKALTDLLKTEFLTVLDLELPMRADGDND